MPSCGHCAPSGGCFASRLHRYPPPLFPRVLWAVQGTADGLRQPRNGHTIPDTVYSPHTRRTAHGTQHPIKDTPSPRNTARTPRNGRKRHCKPSDRPAVSRPRGNRRDRTRQTAPNVEPRDTSTVAPAPAPAKIAACRPKVAKVAKVADSRKVVGKSIALIVDSRLIVAR